MTLGCGDGARDDGTIYDADWLNGVGIDVRPWRDLLARLGSKGFPQALLPSEGMTH